ncbi:ArsC/Spx/MgsR family protein [Litorimonas sp. WD9-15]|uniref:ArsC/Spx/MgsR family protein n=1 Tax=Litorimonas sp. WD9-15 TaxID=3418716 RepID=UPI003D067062
MKIYHLKTCDTCRRAIKALKVAGHDPVLHDVRADGLDIATVEALEAELGFAALVNKKSTTWRGLDDATKEGLSRETAIPLLVENPTLMKRPVIDHDGHYTVGWTKDVQAGYGA